MASSIHERILIKTEDGQWRTSDNDNGTSPPARKEPATTARRLPLPTLYRN